MALVVAAAQLSNQRAEVTWSSTDPDPAAGFKVELQVDGGVWSERGTIVGTARAFTDDLTAASLAVGAQLVYRVTDQTTATAATSPAIGWRDLDVPWTYGPVNALAIAPRYTTVARVKARLGIPASDETKDPELTAAIVAAETQIDQHNHRSFPDVGTNPQWKGIPEPIRQWATDAAVAVYKSPDAPFGSAGADEWAGTLEPERGGDVRSTIERHPLSLGYQTSFGIA